MPKPPDRFPRGNHAHTDADSPWGAFWALVFEAADALQEDREQGRQEVPPQQAGHDGT